MYFMNDVDFDQFIKLLDAALASDDKKIQKALRKFMFIMALNISDDECEPGPFTKMMETMDELQRRLAAIESKDNNFTTTDQWTYPNGYGTGTAGGTPFFPTTTTTITGGSHTSTGTTNWTNIPNATTTTTTGTVTIPSSSSTSNCWVGGAYSGMTNITFGDEDTGTAIKDEIKEKLEKLVNPA